MSHADGRASISSSTLSVGIVIWLASYSRLLSRICVGSIGRNERNADAAAALNMFPKFDDVAIRTYLIVLAKMRRPSTTPSASTPRSLSSRMMSAASFATSVPVSTEMPTSAWCERDRVVDAVAEERDVGPACALDADDARLRLGADACEHRRRDRSRRRARRRPSRRPARRSARPARRGRDPCTPSPLPGRLSPVITLTTMPSRARRASDGAASALGRSRNTRNPTSERPSSSASVGSSSPGAVREATAITREPAS